jgi:low affinity Fe/Cu permease
MNPTLPSGRIPTASSDSSTRPGNGAPQPNQTLREAFRRFSGTIASAVGSPWAFAAAVMAILVWAGLGPHFHYSDTWQLVINTGTTIVTFLMVFLIQNTQNRDARAIHLKLDELIRGTKGSRNLLVDLEECSEEELEQFEKEFRKLRERQKEHVDNGGGSEPRHHKHRQAQSPV